MCHSLYALVLMFGCNKGVADDYTDHELSDSHGSTASENAAIQTPSTINEKALIRKIDLRLLPVLFVIYLAAFLDR